MLGMKRLYWQQYGIAVGTVTIAILLTQLLYSLINPTIFQAFYVSVATSAWFGGFKAGLLAGAISVLGCLYFFIEPLSEFEINNAHLWFRLSSFFLTSQLINFLCSSLQKTKLKIQENIKVVKQSETQFSRLTKTNLFGIIVANVDGTVVEANDAFLGMVGYTREDLREGRINWQGMTPPEYRQVSENSLRELREYGQCKPFEKEYIRKDGDRVPILLGSAFLNDSQELQEKVIGFVLDLSERKRAEMALREKQELFEHFMNNSPARAYIKDASGRYIYVNKVIEQLLNWQQKDWYGKTDFELVGQQTAQQFRQHDLSVLNTEQAIEVEEEITIDNEKRYLTSFKFPFKDASGQQFLAGMSFDVTEQKWNHSLLSLQTQVLTMIATGTELSQTIETLLRLSEQLCEETTCAVLLLNRDRTHLANIIAPSLSFDFKQLIEGGIPVSDRSISCSRAVYHRQPVVVEDIANDPYWQVYRDVTLAQGFQASWSTPILSSRGEILGTLVMYYPTARKPSFIERRLIDVSIYLAGLAIDRQQAEDALQRTNELFEIAISGVKCIIYEWDLNSNRVERMKGLFEVVGYLPEEAEPTADWWRARIHPDDLEKVDGQINIAMASSDSSTTEYRIRHRNGEYRYIWDRALFERNREGKITRVIGCSLDVTERKKAEETQTYLAQASQVLSGSLDSQTTLTSIARLSVPHLADWCTIYIRDEEGSIQQLATSYADREKEIQIARLMQKYPVELNDFHGVANVIRTGQPELYRDISDDLLVAIARNEEHLQLLRTASISSAAIVPMIARGKTLGAIAFFWTESARHYDCQDLVLVQELAQRAALAIDNARIYQIAQRDRASAEVANRIKDEFLATLSHELRTPLNAILGWSQMLVQRNLDDTMKAKALEIIDRNSKSLATLVEDLLDVSHIVTGKVRLNTHPVDLRSIVEAAIVSVRPAANAKMIELDFHRKNFFGQILGDYDRLRQVFWNLLSNAIKFTPNGGRVEINCDRIGSRLQIEIADTGIGIDPDFLPYVFERFRQADSSTTRFYGGLGLGLAIVRHFVELHGGTVAAESEGEGQGAKFIVCLPMLEEGSRE